MTTTVISGDKASVRAAVLAWTLDKIGKFAEECHMATGRICDECPVLSRLVREIKLAEVQDTEEVIDALDRHYSS